MARDADYKALINSVRWRRLRASVLVREPLCVRCKSEGRVSSATEVHHVRPVEEGVTRAAKERLMFSVSNLVGLCHACHAAVHQEMGRCSKAGNRARNERKAKDVIKRFFGDE